MNKILIFSHNSFSSVSNNGKTLLNLFSKFNTDDIGQLYIDNVENPDFSLCHNFFRLTDLDVFMLRKGQIVEDKTMKGVAASKGVRIAKHINTFPFLKVCCRDILWLLFFRNNKKLGSWINKHGFSYLFFVGGNYCFSYFVARKIAKRYNMRLLTFFTDDYFLNIGSSSLLKKIHNHFLKKNIRLTVEKSSLLFGIGDLMCEKYSDYFGRKFHSIMNCVPYKKESLDFHERPVIFTYLGGLHLGRWKSLCQLANILGEFLDAEFRVYTQSYISSDIEEAFRETGIHMKGAVPANKVDKVLFNSTFLIHVESHDPSYRKLTQLSVSTKIPEYLMSSRPIIAFGPSEVASIRLLSENNIGFVIDPEKGVNKKVINGFLKDKQSWINLAQNGHRYAVENYVKDTVSKNLYTLIRNVTI